MKKKTSKIGKELKRIAKENDGILDPEVVISEAKSKKSPLHDSFTWDNTEAAHQFRLEQARHLIRVCVQVEDVNGKDVEYRVFVSLSDERKEEGTGYRIMTDVLSDEDLRRQLLLDAKNEMFCFQQKFSRLAELSKVFSAMKKVLKKLK